MATPQYSIQPNPKVRFQTAYRDQCLLIANKPPGVVTQPGLGHRGDSLLNGAFSSDGKRLQNLGKVRDFGLVHRLDRATSGLVVIALTREAYDAMRSQFENRSIEKTYLALVHGVPKPPNGVVDTPISEVRSKGRKWARLGPGPRAQVAVTEYQVLQRAPAVSLVECQPKTGRLHQIRVHMAQRGCPIVGDYHYGRRVPLDRMMGRERFWLHAARLVFDHPEDGRPMTVQAPPPPPFMIPLEELGITVPKRWL